MPLFPIALDVTELEILVEVVIDSYAYTPLIKLVVTIYEIIS